MAKIKLSPVRYFEVWCGGYRATGNSGKHWRIGSAYARDFLTALLTVMDQHPTLKQHFNPEKMTWWGCRLFDQEVDALRFD